MHLPVRRMGPAVPHNHSALCLKQNIRITANQVYHMMSRFGIVEQKERNSRSGVNGVKKFWSLTAKGCMYGKNITSPANPRELSLISLSRSLRSFLK
jgi:hypothetical protein